MNSLLAMLVIAAAATALLGLRRGEVLRFETAERPEDALMAVIGEFGSRRRWTTVSRGRRSITFGYERPPSKLLAALLLLLCVVPGIVYLILGHKAEAVDVTIAERPGPLSSVQIVSNGYRGKFAARALREELEVRSEELGDATDRARLT